MATQPIRRLRQNLTVVFSVTMSPEDAQRSVRHPASVCSRYPARPAAPAGRRNQVRIRVLPRFQQLNASFTERQIYGRNAWRSCALMEAFNTFFAHICTMTRFFSVQHVLLNLMETSLSPPVSMQRQRRPCPQTQRYPKLALRPPFSHRSTPQRSSPRRWIPEKKTRRFRRRSDENRVLENLRLGRHRRL